MSQTTKPASLAQIITDVIRWHGRLAEATRGMDGVMEFADHFRALEAALPRAEAADALAEKVEKAREMISTGAAALKAHDSITDCVHPDADRAGWVALTNANTMLRIALRRYREGGTKAG